MPSPTFPVKAHRHDLYRNFKFQVLIDAQPVAGFHKMTTLKVSTEVATWSIYGDLKGERKLTVGTKYNAITLEQGLTLDPVFEKWANLVNSPEENSVMSMKIFRRDIIINVLNLQGTVAIAYEVHRAWVSEYQLLPDFDATKNTVGIKSIKIDHEG